MDRLLLRLFEEEEDLYIYLLLDVSDSMRMGRPPKLHYAMQITAALAYVGLANLDRVCVVTFADGLRDRMAPARSKARIFKIFDFLRAVSPGGETKLEPSLRSFAHQNKRNGLALIISDFYDPRGFENGINVLRYNRFEPLAIQIEDPAEANPGLKGDLQLVDCETGDMREVTISPRILASYTKAYEDYCRELEAFCRAKQVPLFRAPLTVPFDELILKIFRRGGFLR
jgi:uncharacterized protein (DUF58 family)